MNTDFFPVIEENTGCESLGFTKTRWEGVKGSTERQSRESKEGHVQEDHNSSKYTYLVKSI